MSEQLKAFAMGANVIGYVDYNTSYAMVCGWATMIEYDKIIMLLGSQSETGNNLRNGMKVGVSALSDKQLDTAKIIGFHHSSENKLSKVDYIVEDNMILIPNSSCIMKCTVINIQEINDSKDHLVLLNVDSFTNYNTSFLNGYDKELQ